MFYRVTKRTCFCCILSLGQLANIWYLWYLFLFLFVLPILANKSDRRYHRITKRFAGELVDDIVTMAFDDRCQFDVLWSSLSRHRLTSESEFLWQVAFGLPVESAASLIATMRRSAVHNGKRTVSAAIVAYCRMSITKSGVACVYCV